MGIKERHERDREAVRRGILDAARDLFVREGFANVSIRKIAERIEYSPAAIYSYFPSKDDIFYALAEEGFRLLHDPQAHEALLALPPLERLRATFWRFYQFSVDQPEYFSLMFVDRAVPSIRCVYERFAFAAEIKQDLIDHVQECIDEGLLPRTAQALSVFRLVIGGLLGVAVMRLANRLSPGENADDLARDVLDIMLTGLMAGAPVRSAAASSTHDTRAGRPS
jgi:AcrR family transcriptional regulator